MKIKELGIYKKIKSFFEKKENCPQDYNFYPLSPTDQIKNGKSYFDALNWALNNDKIKNIALTGPYGSGKSSILQSFQKQNTNTKFHFLDISLATFKEEEKKEEKQDPPKDDADKTIGEDLLRLIELSILQQLFYREEDRKLPYSRLKKIRSFTWKNLIFTTIVCFLFLISLLLLIKQDILSYIFPTFVIPDYLKIIFLLCCFVGSVVIIYKLIPMFHNLKVSKLNISNVEIEISNKINKSVLNHNLDEILYFFEATEYNVVIIEDLDRFQETEIFTKLREINLLINNSKKINRHIVFIYAIRDEMFTDKDRTKFFDFIIPVIPVINNSNSNEMLKKEIKNMRYKVSEALIDDISLFIDEMRLLYNIINEFKIYKQLLSDELDEDKLLAMIVYKNICPRDFVKLSNYEGILYETICEKQKYVKQKREKIDDEILKHRTEIKNLNTLQIKDTRELRAAYILQYANQLERIISFNIDGNDYDFVTVLEDNIFPYFIEDKVKYNYMNNNYYNQARTDSNIKFIDIEKEVNSEYTYKEREQLIENWNNGKIEELKRKIRSLLEQKDELMHEKLQNLIDSKEVILEKNSNQKKLINLLLHNGYIGEDYLGYISIFHEISISRNDHTFLLNLKSSTKTDFEHRLDKIDKLINKINLIDFEKEYILNYQLVDYVLGNNGYEKQKEAIFNFLKNKQETSIEFISGFIDNGTNVDKFFGELCHYWHGIWSYISAVDSLSDDKIYIYFNLIIKNGKIEDIKAIANKSNLKEYISEQNNFCSIINDEEKIKQVLNILEIKFTDLDLIETPKDLFDYIYENNHYQINDRMIKIMLQEKGNFNQTNFDTKNYYTIKKSDCDNLIIYINNKISEYISNVYLELENNTNENEDCLIELLNNEHLDLKEKESIIKQVETKISTLLSINDYEVKNLLLNNSKLLPNWKDVETCFINNENAIPKPVNTFLNNVENAKFLSVAEINKEDYNNDFLEALLLSKEIENSSYAQIIKPISELRTYDSLAFDSLPKDKITLLIQNNILELNDSNYTLLKDNFSNLHFTLIEKRHFELTDELLEKLIFDNEDIIDVLESTSLPVQKKQMIVDAYDEGEIINSAKILNLLKNICLNHPFNMNKNVLMVILTKKEEKEELRIELYNKQYSILNEEDITIFLNSLSEPYSDIVEKGKRPLLQNTEPNKLFAENLKENDYISNYNIGDKGIRISTFRK